MGLFDIFGSNKRRAAEMEEMISGITASFPGILALGNALKTIGHQPPEGPRWTAEETGAGAAALTLHYVRETRTDILEPRAAMGAALFSLIAMNHFSRVVRSDFEQSGLHAMLPLMDSPEMAKELLPEVLEIYNEWSADQGNHGKLVGRVGHTIALWASNPTEQHRQAAGASFLFLARRGEAG